MSDPAHYSRYTGIDPAIGLRNLHCQAIRAFKLCQRVQWSRWSLFAFTFLVLFAANQSRAIAGCHYGDGRSFKQVSDHDNPREHARNFRFLGQWIYEAGEMKYVSWQGSKPCQGPNCHADDPRPETTSSPATSVQRLPTFIGLVEIHLKPAAHSPTEWLLAADLSPFTGFPHEHEYPP